MIRTGKKYFFIKKQLLLKIRKELVVKKLLLILFYIKNFLLIYHLIQPFGNKKGLIIVSFLKKAKRHG